MTQAFVPFLREAGQGRIVMMSSSLDSIGEQLDMTSGAVRLLLMVTERGARRQSLRRQSAPTEKQKLVAA